MRVHQLAAELGMPARDLVDELRAAGEWVASHRSTVPDPVVRRYRLERPPPNSQPTPAAPAALPQTGQPQAWHPQPWQPRRWPRRPGPKPVTMRDPDPWDDDDNLRYQPSLTTRDVAQLLGTTMATVRQWVARGYLTPTGKLGPSNVFDRDSVLAAHQAIQGRRRATGQRVSTRGRVTVRPADRVPLKYHDKPVTTDEAAQLIEVSPVTIRAWVHRGHLSPLQTPARRPLVFRLGDVIDAANRRQPPRPGPRRRPRT